MTSGNNHPTIPADRATPDASPGLGRAVFAFAFALFAARMIYLLWICPYELTGDEAHYWEWSRRLALSYYTKGPGIAWTIWLGTHLLGVSELGVRWLAVVASLISTLVVAALAHDVSRGDRRVALLAAVAFNLAPGYQVISVLMTIDGPYVACWLVAAWSAMRAWISIERGRSGGAWWLLLGAALGVGFLYKYTILLLLPGLVLFALLRRKRFARGPVLLGASAALLVAVAAASPVIIWNVREGWPTVRHLLGHLKVEGGDMTGRPKPAWSPIWPVAFLGSQIAMVGPFALLLMWGGATAAWVARRNDPAAWDRRILLLCMGLPVILFYVAISFFVEAEGNWPIAGYATLLVLLAEFACSELDSRRAALEVWRAKPEPRPHEGFLLSRRPETAGQIAWHWMVGYGVAAAVVLHYLPLVAVLPGTAGLMNRVGGFKAQAARVEALRVDLRAKTGQEPILAADLYQPASRLAFYLPDKPVVRCAGHLMGNRPSAYDYFDDTRWDDPALLARPAILLGGSEPQWNTALEWNKLDVAWHPPPGDRSSVLWVARGFDGVKSKRVAPR
ncbi:MAG: glycosyltransferase family 39 protein [Planctomycetota bacterium]|nr:glycosyltransferase family 39 protein [Planctomycetota bacterium]